DRPLPANPLGRLEGRVPAGRGSRSPRGEEQRAGAGRARPALPREPLPLLPQAPWPRLGARAARRHSGTLPLPGRRGAGQAGAGPPRGATAPAPGQPVAGACDAGAAPGRAGMTLPEPIHVCFLTGEYPPMRGGVGDYTALIARAL